MLIEIQHPQGNFWNKANESELVYITALKLNINHKKHIDASLKLLEKLCAKVALFQATVQFFLQVTIQNDKNMHVTALILQGCQPPTSSNKENMTSLPATTKRLTGVSHQG